SRTPHTFWHARHNALASWMRFGPDSMYSITSGRRYGRLSDGFTHCVASHTGQASGMSHTRGGFNFAVICPAHASICETWCCSDSTALGYATNARCQLRRVATVDRKSVVEGKSVGL